MEFYMPEKGVSKLMDIRLKIPRYGHISVTLDDGRVVVAGGMGLINGKPQPLNDTEMIQVYPLHVPKMVAAMNRARVFAAACNNHGHVYVCGGRGLDLAGYKDCEIYEPENDKWGKFDAKMTFGRWYFGLVAYTPDPKSKEIKLFAFGGKDGDEDHELYEFYPENPGKNKWGTGQASTGQSGWYGFGIVNGTDPKDDPVGSTYQFGGRHRVSVVKCYDLMHNPKRLECEILPAELSCERYGSSAVNYEQQLHSIGGSEDPAMYSIDVFDPKKHQWQSKGQVLNYGRANASAVLIGV